MAKDNRSGADKRVDTVDAMVNEAKSWAQPLLEFFTGPPSEEKEKPKSNCTCQTSCSCVK